MSALAEKIRKAREIKVKAGGVTFICRRPSDLEMIELRGRPTGRGILPFIIGWEGVTEQTITGTGAPHPLDFDAAACAEWLQDRLDLLGAVMQDIVDAYQAHTEKTAGAIKN
ncbi:hypothetical protein [Pseudomonas sp.]|uniref:hypothetical protein n=1 Tax=Pseudomonas sp. TaxID=306 RepID=UPI003F338424